MKRITISKKTEALAIKARTSLRTTPEASGRKRRSSKS